MRTIEISDEAYQAIAAHHGDVTTFVEQMAREAAEVAAVQEGLDAYKRGESRPIEEFGAELQQRFGIKTPDA